MVKSDPSLANLAAFRPSSVHVLGDPVSDSGLLVDGNCLIFVQLFLSELESEENASSSVPRDAALPWLPSLKGTGITFSVSMLLSFFLYNKNRSFPLAKFYV